MMEIYFSDLTKEAQQRLLDWNGISDPKEMNWDIDVIPLGYVSICIDIEDEIGD